MDANFIGGMMKYRNPLAAVDVYVNPLFQEEAGARAWEEVSTSNTPANTSDYNDDSTSSASLLNEVILSVLQQSSSRSPELVDPQHESDSRTARVVQESYKYVTNTAIQFDSSQEDSTPSSEKSRQPSPRSVATYPSDYLESSGTTVWDPSEADQKSPYDSKGSGGESARSTSVQLSGRFGSGRTRGPHVRKANLDAEAARPTRREISGWLVCSFGTSGFMVVLWIVFPLLIFSLFAASGGFTSAPTVHCPYGVENRDPKCLKVCDSFTENLTSWTSGSVGGNQSRSSGATILEILSSNSWQPAALITVMLGVSVLVQLVVFTVTSPFLDYGKFQQVLPALGTMVVVAASVLPINLFRPGWWWIAGVLFLFSIVGIAQVSAWLDHYLSSLSRGIPVLRTRMFDEVQIYRSVRIRFVNRLSFAGITLGCCSSVICTLATYFLFHSRTLAERLGVDRNNWPLRIACCVGGAWLFLWHLISYALLVRGRAGPSLESIPYPAVRHLPVAILGMGFGSFAVRKGRSAVLILLVCFLSSLGNATVFQSGLLCLSPKNFIKLALFAQLSSFLGTVLFFFIQAALSRNSKHMLVIILLFQLLPPIYACLGFVNTASKSRSRVLGLNREWEIIVFASAHGLCFGAHRSHIRILFLASIPSPNSVGAYVCLFQVVNQLSTFVGTLEMMLFVYHNGNLRYTFITMVVALLLAVILLMKYITEHLATDDREGLTETESNVYPASLISESVQMSSHSGKSDYSVGVYIPRSLRRQYTSRPQQEDLSER